ncbi:MAG: acyl-CoA dehydrogenase family protein [Alphaproteobacteria bacterium]
MTQEAPKKFDEISAETSREWIARARSLKPMIEAAAPEIEKNQIVPDHLLDALHEAQIFRTVLPRSVGGAELNPATHAQVVAAIAEGDASVAWCVAQNAMAMMASAYVEPHVAQDVFGDSRAVFTFGFTRGDPPCLAIPVKDGWRISGTWTFASGNRIATWLGGHCRLCDDDGTPLKNPDGRFVERTMIFPRAAATFDTGQWEVMGLCGTGSDTYSVSDLFVPNDYTVLPRVSARDHNRPEDEVIEPETERREQGVLYRHSTQLIATSGLCSVAIGAAQAALDAFILVAREKTPSNAGSLRDDAWIQARIAQADAKISSSKAWFIQLLDQAWDECVSDGQVSFPLRVRLRQAGTYMIDSAMEAVDIVFREAGATAIFRNNPFERRFRDVHTVSIQVQGSIARMQSVGQHHLGITPQQLILIP